MVLGFASGIELDDTGQTAVISRVHQESLVRALLRDCAVVVPHLCNLVQDYA
jgi:hypothetical protein